ncbi:MAG: pantoate--beta-alanine ligase [Deltaproteobacteria bacterium]|nr:pantoate--beta-alanine ligase [Deltaproteobacteria bacterium]
MNIINKIEEMQKISAQIKKSGKTIVLVPTMGYLHEGHLSLVRIGQKVCDIVIVSIFVNPTQFGPAEDLDSYPKDLERDCALLKKEGVETVFAPASEELYPAGYQTYVNTLKLSEHLCGISRPALFQGVTTVLTKLFNIVNPDKAVFGKKDFQQFVIVSRMVKDLNFNIEIIGAPIIREADGLAMSSRNAYLKKNQRDSALSLYKALKKAENLVKKGEKKAEVIINAASKLINSFDEILIDYISICDFEFFEEVKIIDRPVLMALAVKAGRTRLIDNIILFQ